jgi:hypothetical protein
MTARLAVLTLAAILAMGGLGIGVAKTLDDDAAAGGVEPIELRKDDSAPELIAQADEDDDPTGDGDRTRGDDGTSGGNNTGDGDRTRGDDGTSGGDNTGDGDRSRGDDGTSGGNNTDGTAGADGTAGGDNTFAAPPPAPAPADGGYYGGDDSGFGDDT